MFIEDPVERGVKQAFRKSFDSGLMFCEAQPFERSEFAHLEEYQTLEAKYRASLAALKEGLSGPLRVHLNILCTAERAMRRVRDQHYFQQGGDSFANHMGRALWELSKVMDAIDTMDTPDTPDDK